MTAPVVWVAALAFGLATPLQADDASPGVSVGGSSSLNMRAVGAAAQTDVFKSGPEPTESDSDAERPATGVDFSTLADPPPLPAATEEAAPADAAADTLPESEEIRERYRSGAIRLIRHVVQDERGNYMNHGPWTLFEEDGVVIAEGQFVRGAMHGNWRRVFQSGQGEMLQGPLYQRFTPPFTAETQYDHGLLSGTWTIHDAQGRPASSWQFERGQRHGLCQWWFENGQLWREANYQNGRLDGRVRQWSDDGEPEQDQQYLAGRRRDVKVEWYKPGVKKSEVELLLKRDVEQYEYDFLDGIARHQTLSREGRDERHGRWTAWYPSGERQLEGQFEHGVPVGTWTWWHASGQLASQGDYIEGRQQGVWTWWHENGQKSIVGHYAGGQQAGDWTWWTPQGKVEHRSSYVARAPKPGAPAAPHSGLPSPRRPLRQALRPSR